MYDAIIIGGGPAGATTAAVLAEKGRSVLILEREKFPRFQIGESLIPYNNDIFRKMGLFDVLDDNRFVRKFGAEFVTGDGSRRHRFRFGSTLPEKYARTFQVRRAEFDQILLDHARGLGVEVREQTRVSSVDLTDSSRAVVTAVDALGQETLVEGRVAVDASGYVGVLANKVATRKQYESLKKIAIFAHYRNVVPSAEGDDAGNIVIVILRDGWFWMIPVSDQVTSVGLVIDKESFGTAGLEPREILDQTIRDSPYVASRMADAGLESQIYVRRDFSYRMSSLVGSNYVLAGDAAGFIDPIFSTGVMLAMKSGELAAKGIDDLIESGSMRNLRRYERRVQKAFDRYEAIISRFYSRGFIEVFLNPLAGSGLVGVVIALLAGNVFESSSSRWRLQVFYALVAIQSRRKVIAPAIAWDKLPKSAAAAKPEEHVV